MHDQPAATSSAAPVAVLERAADPERAATASAAPAAVLERAAANPERAVAGDARPQFQPHSPLRRELNRRVAEYFATTGQDERGGAAMLAKSAVILGWAVASYTLLLLWASTWWTAALLCGSLGLALAGIGFSVMHDGGHGAYSRRPWVNRLAAAVLDAIGGSSYFWRHKHNVLHHTYTNVEGVDDDIDAGPFLRMAESQPLRWAHRFQHLYMVPLLGLFFATKWILLDDFRSWYTGRVGGQAVPRPRGGEAVLLVAGKLCFVGWAFVLPLALHPPLHFALAYLLVAFVLGVTLGLVFQLAHCVEGTEFEAPRAPGAQLPRAFVEHQLATTADFAPRSRLVTWYVGGLNFQVEHHLFPRISHLHYPALAEIVRATCAERGLVHRRHETLWGALASHVRFMRRLGRPRAAPLAG